MSHAMESCMCWVAYLGKGAEWNRFVWEPERVSLRASKIHSKARVVARSATHRGQLGDLRIQRRGGHCARGIRGRQLLLELSDLVTGGADAAPLPTKVAGVSGGTEQEEHDGGMHEGDGLALQDSEVTVGGHRLLRKSIAQREQAPLVL
eukprot:912353-Prorocentrum_minimum.AAC.1